MYSCHLFLISSAPVESLMFLSFIKPILSLHEMFPWYLSHLYNSFQWFQRYASLWGYYYSLDNFMSWFRAGWVNPTWPSRKTGAPLQKWLLAESVVEEGKSRNVSLQIQPSSTSAHFPSLHFNLADVAVSNEGLHHLLDVVLPKSLSSGIRIIKRIT